MQFCVAIRNRLPSRPTEWRCSPISPWVPHNNSLGQATPIFVIDGAGAGGIGNASADTWIRCEDACAAWGGCSAGSEGGGYCGL